VAPLELFPSSDEIGELLKQTTFVPPVNDTNPEPLESLPPSAIMDEVIFEATNCLYYEDIYPPFNDELGYYFDILCISFDPSPQSNPNIIIKR